MHRPQRAPIQYIPAYAKRETWITAYTHNFPSIDLADVELVYSRGRVLGDGLAKILTRIRAYQSPAEVKTLEVFSQMSPRVLARRPFGF